MGRGGRQYDQSPEASDPTSFSRSKMSDHVERVAKSGEADQAELHDDKQTGDKISYGKKFAKTEEMYAARQMNRELEELAKQDGALEEEEERDDDDEGGGTPVLEAKGDDANEERRDAPSEAAPRQGGKMDAAPLPEQRTHPIGALPPAEEPPPREAFAEVLADATRYAGLIRSSVHDIVAASMRLARLPVEVALLMANKIRPMKA